MKSAAYSMRFAEIHNETHYFLSFYPFLLVKSQNLLEMCGNSLNIYIYI